MEDTHLEYSAVQSLEETSEYIKFIVILQRISVLFHLDHLDSQIGAQLHTSRLKFKVIYLNQTTH